MVSLQTNQVTPLHNKKSETNPKKKKMKAALFENAKSDTLPKKNKKWHNSKIQKSDTIPTTQHATLLQYTKK